MRYWMMASVAVGSLAMATCSAHAQFVTQSVYYPAPAATYVQPAPVVVAPTYAPPAVVYQPVAANALVPNPLMQRTYNPWRAVVSRPTIPVTVMAPAPVVTTRYRPILGGTVSRAWYP